MGQQADASERRENARFTVDGNAVAVMGPVDNGLGHVIELSLSGFSFICDEGGAIASQVEENLTFFGFETMCLGRVPMTCVSDMPETDEQGEVIRRRLGVRFDKLSKSQKEQLRHFIYHNAYIEI